MDKNQLWKEMIAIIKKDVVPATGCTEPVSLAFASASAAKYIDEPIEAIHARVSANLMKNGKGVMVPGTGMPGLYIAAAVGALGGNSDAGLQVLKSLSPHIVAQGKRMVDEGKVTLDVNYDTSHVLYSEAEVISAHHKVKVVIVDSHTNIISIEKDGDIIYQTEAAVDNSYEEKIKFLQKLTVAEVVEFAEQVDLEDIKFIQEAEVLNNALSLEGLNGNYGLKIGHSLKMDVEKGLLGDDLQNQVIMRTVAASDARMGGAPAPAMTNSGSGNQGIAATMPVTVVADYLKVDEETRIRSLALAHMMAIFIHGYLPKLSAFCATITAAMGAASGMVWLLDRPNALARINNVICSMTGDASGMICDGAANSCSMKVATAVTSAFRSVLLSLKDIRVSGDDGLVAYKVEDCIKNIGMLATNGMQQTDQEVLNIMLHKN